MRREVVRSFKKALSIVLIFGAVFMFIMRKWLIAGAMLAAAFLLTTNDEPAARSPERRDSGL